MNKIMKSTLGLALTLGFAQCSTAQIKAVNSAEYALMSNTVEDLVIAKEEIDKAKLNPKTAELPKMYLVRADVYSRIAGAKGNELLNGLTDKAGLEATISMNKFFQSTLPKKEDDLETAIGLAGNSFAAAFNESTPYFNSNDSLRFNELCIYYGELVALYDKLDTSMSNNLANNKITKASILETYAQVASLHTDKATRIKIIQGLVDQGNVVPALVEGLSRSYISMGDTAKAEACIRQALITSNNDGAMFQVLVNHFVSIGKEKQLFNDVDKQIGIDPTSRLYYTRAFLYESQEKYDLAIADYKKSVELDEFNYDANFNLGLALMKYESRKLYDKRSAAQGAKRKLVEQELINLFTDAKKYLERALDNVDYSTADQINICKALKNACLEISDASGAEKYGQLVKSMEADAAGK
ncbi:MAG: tetratricopeptide repeat protein [Bacteroidetes bacterium]|nr:tetratricopeptide repeat protein [Bacteroidota bacterium]